MAFQLKCDSVKQWENFLLFLQLSLCKLIFMRYGKIVSGLTVR